MIFPDASETAPAKRGEDMIESLQMVVFLLAEQRFAVPLLAVERVVRAVEITPLPETPDLIHGVINVYGAVVPVIATRRRFGLPDWENVRLSDQFIIARLPSRTVALVVDSVVNVVTCDQSQITTSEKILPGLEHVKGVLRMPDGMVFVHDLESFLSLQEERELHAAVEHQERLP
jgi:purine-binding chemotaxis protein CheW